MAKRKSSLPPLPKKEAIYVRLPEDLNMRLQKRVDEIGVSRSSYVLMLIYQSLGEPKEKKEAER